MRLFRILILSAAFVGLAACAPTHPGETSASGPTPHYQQNPRTNPDAGFQRAMGGGPSYF